MTYATQSDLTERFGEETIRLLSDHERTGSINSTRVTAALTAAEDMADSYLSSRYTVPIETPSTSLVEAVCDMAVYLLNRKGATDEHERRFNDAIKFLKDVQKGVAAIQGAEKPEEGSDGIALFFTVPIERN